jgi:hypothetical protein
MRSTERGSGAGAVCLIMFLCGFGLIWLVWRLAGGKGASRRDLFTFKYTYK